MAQLLRAALFGALQGFAILGSGTFLVTAMLEILMGRGTELLFSVSVVLPVAFGFLGTLGGGMLGMNDYLKAKAELKKQTSSSPKL